MHTALKKWILFAFLLPLSFFTFNLEGYQLFENSFSEETFCPRVDAKAGYFFFLNKKMRDVYDNGAFGLQLSGSYPINRCLHIYGGVGFIEARGRSLNFHQKTTLWKIPVDLGLKTIVSMSPCFDWYAALGPRYFYAHQHNDSSFVNRNIGKSGCGVFLNSGVDYYLTPCFSVNLFGEYSYEPIHPSSSKKNVYTRNIDVGGLFFGAGLSYSF